MAQLPPNPTFSRELAIRQKVSEGASEYAWSNITSEHGCRRGVFSIFSDALKIDGVRVNVTAETSQVIADSLDCMLLTPRLADLAWEQRDVTLPPFPRRNPTGMSTTQAMTEHSLKIDNTLAKIAEPYGIIATTGKHWVLDNALENKFHYGVPVAMNYGWHFEGSLFGGSAFEAVASKGSPSRLIQGRGTRHDMRHVDYSQTCVLVHRVCWVDGIEMDLADLLSDPNLAPLASHQGVLKVLRQPGVPKA